MASNKQMTLAMVRTVDLKGAITKLETIKSVGISALCEEYRRKLADGGHEEELCESFLVELSKVAKGSKSREVMESLEKSIKKNAANIAIAKGIYKMRTNGAMFVAPVIESALVNYMVDKNAETRKEARRAMSIMEGNVSVKKISEVLTVEALSEKMDRKLVNAVLVNEQKEETPKTYTQEEVDRIIENRIAETRKEDEASRMKKTVGSIPNRINLHGVITNILKENSGNDKLRMFCERYMDALNRGKSDEVLYESFISGISNWNYLSAVDTEMSALKDRVSKYRQEIDLKKILRLMEETGSYYIVPLIEDVVVDFAEKKDMKSRILMLQRLESFEYDPFVRDIIMVANRDMSKNVNVYLGESVENPNAYVKSEKIYSPVLYIGEGACVFNVKGTYYKRQGNSIDKLVRKDVENLLESFRGLCRLVNSSDVKISEDNRITVYSGRNSAVVSESEVTVNGKKVTAADLDNLASTAVAMRESDMAGFYSAVKTLNENFDSIASIDFVKRISSRDNSGLAVDVFKVGSSICINTINESIAKSTFYRNVNPIQCANYINEHMGINVTSLFEDVLPEQEKVKKDIDEKKAKYEEYIAELKSKRDELEKMKDESSDVDDINAAIDMIDKEIEDTESDYMKYQKDSDKFLTGKDDNEKEDGEKEEGEDDENEPKETQSDMEEPITDNNPVDAPEDIPSDAAAVEPEEGDYSDVIDFDPDFDVPHVADTVVDGEPVDGAPAENDDACKVVRVSYNKNVKAGKVSDKGEVIIVIPSVDANGDVHDDMRKVTFYIDRSTGKPVLNNEYMPLNLYNIIIDAILKSPETEGVAASMENGDFDDDDDNPGGGESEIPEVEGEGDETEGGDDSVDDMIPDELKDVLKDIKTDDKDEKPEENLEENPEGESEEKPEEENKPEDAPEEKDGAEKKDDGESEDVKRESPAETKDAQENAEVYPITVDLYPDEISPMEMDDFKKDLDGMKIEHSENESGDGGVCMKLCNLAQVHALKKYFNKWMNYNDDNFKSFFPELKKCFNNEQTDFPVGPKNEGFSVILPATREYCRLLGVSTENLGGQMTVIAESAKEAQEIYTRLYSFSKNHNVEQDVTDLLEYYAPKYAAEAEKLHKYTLELPYNGFLESKLESRGIGTVREGDKMKSEIFYGDYRKTGRLLESFYGNDIPESASDFIKFVNEGVKITVKDDTTGKTIEIDTDDFNGKSSEEKDESADFDSSFKDTTFDYNKSMDIFKDDEESSDEKGEKKEGDEENEENNEELEVKDEKDASGEKEEETEEKGEKEEKEDNGEKEEEPKKKKFKFRAKKEKKEESNESVSAPKGDVLNENAKATVLDYVVTPEGKKGQIICQMADGSLIVNVDGHTIPYERRQLKMTKERPDTLDYPMEEWAARLKGLTESYVNCGMFVNNMRVTPNDCKVRLMEYMSAKDGDEIQIVIEGEATKADRKYIRITESVADVLDLANYADGKMSLMVEGRLVESDVLVNVKDYMKYKNVNEEVFPVRTLVFDDNSETHLRYVNGTNLRLNESGDIYVPDYEASLKRAVLMSK